MGDFNVTLKLDEHSARKSTISSDMQEFIDCVNNIEVEDVCMTGMHYTWIKSPSNPSTSILKKLDRVMENEEFITKYNQACVSEFLPMVERVWNEEIYGFHIVESPRNKLKASQLDVSMFSHDTEKKVLAALTLDEYNEAMIEVEKFLYQSAKIDWLSEGDRNTAYFHKVVNSRRNRNKIMSISNTVGDCVEGSKIAEEFVKNFDNFLGQTSPVHHLDSLHCSVIAYVLRSMQIYWASVFLLPKTLVKDIEKVLKGFLWCPSDLARGRLQTQDMIFQWNNDSTMRYFLCNLCMDSHDHLFVQCNLATNVWKAVKAKSYVNGLKQNSEDSINCMATNHCKTIKSIASRIVFGVVVLVRKKGSSYSGSDAGGMYSSSYGGDYISRGSDVSFVFRPS
ncbi:RNA-directed DNA polymerase, eukaryota, reverse transcriptase zinc-binding domain protein [Tanacetum coccineum]|uniref:RNA-directed DNA polymerase, eukaryota, reverse transcriptase zinc-binding domain protein n=1 Tax=Tanacetum coccineum TaxID=301880 RepID=A0ABQ4WBN5_9ASTR